MAAVNLLSATAAKRYGAVPVAYVDEHTLLLAMSDPANVLAIDDIALLTRLDVKPAVASAEDIAALISRMNRFEDAVQEAVDESEERPAPLEIVDLRESAEDAPVIKLVHSIIAQAAERGASDIHFEPQPDDQGPLRPRAARADADRRRAHRRDHRAQADGGRRGLADQDHERPGHLRAARAAGRARRADDRGPPRRRARGDDPSVHGESVVLRILDKDSIRLELEKLGMQEHELERVPPGLPPRPRRGADHRPHRLGQVDHALRRAAGAQHARRRTSSRSRTRSSTRSRASRRCRSTTRRA